MSGGGRVRLHGALIPRFVILPEHAEALPHGRPFFARCAVDALRRASFCYRHCSYGIRLQWRCFWRGGRGRLLADERNLAALCLWCRFRCDLGGRSVCRLKLSCDAASLTAVEFARACT